MKIVMIIILYLILFYSFFKISFWFRKKSKKKEIYAMTEITILENHFKVQVRKINIDKLLNIIALSNAIIFTIVLMSTIFISNLIIRLLVMFVLLTPLIYLVYYNISKYLKKRGF